jgi:hypothetical protein
MTRLVIRAERRAIDQVYLYSSADGAIVLGRHRRVWKEDAQHHVRRHAHRNVQWETQFPFAPADVAGASRLLRRLARLDQSVIAEIRGGWVAIRNGAIYDFRPGETFRQIGTLRQCRIPLQVLSSGDALLFGEYGSNPERRPVAVWQIRDGAQECLFEFPAGRARHVHGVFEDAFTGRYWIATGDFENESWLVSADHEFRDVQFVGDGSQRYRAVTMFFHEDSVVWLTDSQFVLNHVVRLDRRSGAIEIGQSLPSPAWFGKELSDGWFLAGCAWEHGAGCLRDGATLLASRNTIDWEEVGFWKKDVWPAPWFRDGVIHFAPGRQTSEDFVLFGEGLRGLDGKMLQCSLM